MIERFLTLLGLGGQPYRASVYGTEGYWFEPSGVYSRSTA